MSRSILSAPPESGPPTLGRTLPSLLDEACRRNPNEAALNRFADGSWEPLSTRDFARRSDRVALGLRDLDLDRGDRVALYMDSDVPFCVADMACLIAGLVDVPIYLTHADEAVAFVLKHSEARAVVISDRDRLETIAPLLAEAEDVEHVILAEQVGDHEVSRLRADVHGARLITLERIHSRGAELLAGDPEAPERLRSEIDPADRATIIYTSGTTGRPKGVALTHQNISSNALDSFAGLPNLGRGDEEVAASFLPLTHVFQRTMQYGYVSYGHTVYFMHPDEIARHVPEVRPTLFATVPRILERVVERIRTRGSAIDGWRRRVFDFAMDRARRHELGRRYRGTDWVAHRTADLLVYRQWRDALGGRVKYVISGGAPLRGDLVELFDAAGITVLQGYGLTETSPVIAFNRPDDNRPGTVGVPIAGVEVTLAEDGEILTRGPHVMEGYFRDRESTEEVIDADGWFSTGDVGKIEDGHLRVTDRKKSLFKLSTGKYVVPQPVETSLEGEFLVEKALVVGEARKFCTALIFPDVENLNAFVREHGDDGDRPLEELVELPAVREEMQRMVDRANEPMDPWSRVKYFTILPVELRRDSELMTPTLKLRRHAIVDVFEDEIDRMYEEAGEELAAEEEEPG